MGGLKTCSGRVGREGRRSPTHQLGTSYVETSGTCVLQAVAACDSLGKTSGTLPVELSNHFFFQVVKIWSLKLAKMAHKQ